MDSTGAEFAGGGLNLTLRDLARFGEMMRLEGRFNGQQIVPKAVVDDIRRGGDRALFAPRRLQDVARLELPEHVVGLAQRSRRVHGARHSRSGDLHRSRGGNGHRPVRVASARRQRQSRPHVAAGVRRRGASPGWVWFEGTDGLRGTHVVDLRGAL